MASPLQGYTVTHAYTDTHASNEHAHAHTHSHTAHTCQNTHHCSIWAWIGPSAVPQSYSNPCVIRPTSRLASENCGSWAQGDQINPPLRQLQEDHPCAQSRVRMNTVSHERPALQFSLSSQQNSSTTTSSLPLIFFRVVLKKMTGWDWEIW